jgi:hypothetical protein
MTLQTPRRNANSPAYYLGRPASFWIRALRRQPAPSVGGAGGPANVGSHR